MTLNTAIETTMTAEEMDAEIKEIATVEAPKPAKLSKAEKDEFKKEQEEAERAARRREIKALVPWPVGEIESQWNSSKLAYGYQQTTAIDQWMDDQGRYPRVYRAYSRDEWKGAIKLLADTVADLATTHPDYQRLTGLYVEEQADDLLLIRSKKWQLVIQIPGKATTSGKRFTFSAAPGREAYGMEAERLDGFTELLTKYVPDEHRDTLLDICCQYLRDIRIRVNKGIWAGEHADIAYLLKSPTP